MKLTVGQARHERSCQCRNGAIAQEKGVAQAVRSAALDFAWSRNCYNWASSTKRSPPTSGTGSRQHMILCGHGADVVRVRTSTLARSRAGE